MIEVRGAKELVAKLQELKRTHAKAAIRKGTREGCKIIAEAIKAAAPQRTGALKRSIKVRALPRSNRAVGTDVKLDNSVLFYGGFLEFGTKHQKATNFMREATEQVADAAIAKAVDVIKDEIEKRMLGD